MSDGRYIGNPYNGATTSGSCALDKCFSNLGCVANGCGTAGCGANGCGVDGCGVAACGVNACPINGCITDGCIANLTPLPGPLDNNTSSNS